MEAGGLREWDDVECSGVLKHHSILPKTIKSPCIRRQSGHIEGWTVARKTLLYETWASRSCINKQTTAKNFFFFKNKNKETTTL